MGGRVDGMRPITTSTITINNCYKISRGRVDGLARTKPTSSITRRNSNTYIIRNTNIIKMVGVQMDGILRPIHKTSTTTYTQPFIAVHVEING